MAGRWRWDVWRSRLLLGVAALGALIATGATAGAPVGEARTEGAVATAVAETPVTDEAPAGKPGFYRPQARLGPPSALELALFEATNEERAAAGLAELGWDPALAEVGRIRVRQLVEQEYFAHTDPSGYSMYVELLDGAGIDYSIAGENLALNNYALSESAERAHEALMASPPHARNVLEARFSRVGVGEMSRADGVHVYAIIFLG